MVAYSRSCDKQMQMGSSVMDQFLKQETVKEKIEEIIPKGDQFLDHFLYTHSLK